MYYEYFPLFAGGLQRTLIFSILLMEPSCKMTSHLHHYFFMKTAMLCARMCDTFLLKVNFFLNR